MPGPFGGRADRVHDSFGEYFGQGPTKKTKQREAEAIDPDIVVFPVFTWRLQRPGIPFAALTFNREISVTVDDI